MLMVSAFAGDSALGWNYAAVVGCNVEELVEVIALDADVDSYTFFHEIMEEVVWEAALVQTKLACTSGIVEPHVAHQFAQRIALHSRLVDSRDRRFPGVHLCSVEKPLNVVHDHIGSDYILQLVSEHVKLDHCLVMQVGQLILRGVIISLDCELMAVEYETVTSFDSCSASFRGAISDVRDM